MYEARFPVCLIHLFDVYCIDCKIVIQALFEISAARLFNQYQQVECPENDGMINKPV